MDKDEQKTYDTGKFRGEVIEKLRSIEATLKAYEADHDAIHKAVQANTDFRKNARVIGGFITLLAGLVGWFVNFVVEKFGMFK